MSTSTIRGLLPDGSLPSAAVGHVEELIDQRAATVDTTLVEVLSDPTSESHQQLLSTIAAEAVEPAEQAAVAYLASEPGVKDAAVAAMADEATRIEALTGTFARTVGSIDLAEFLLPGETLPNDGTTDAQPLFQRAVDHIGDHQATLGPRQVVVPAGRYRLNTPIAWRSGAGLRGTARNEVVLLPQGTASAIDGNQNGVFGHWFEDCVFQDFTIDGVAASSTPGQSWTKGVFIQFMRRCSFERVAVKNTWMTGFGVDFLDDVTFINCHAENAGRGAVANIGAGAGFGFATGYFPTEAVVVTGCTSINNRTHGFFTENKHGHNVGHDFFSGGFRLIGSYASGNWNGFHDSGSSGAIVSGCHFIGNKESGATIGRTGANDRGGRDGLITGCVITDNGTDTGSNSCGIQLREMHNGNYRIEGNEIARNGRSGIYAGGRSIIGPNVTIKNNTIRDHAASGIRITVTSETTAPIAWLNITDNDFIDNGTSTSQSDRDGITIHQPLLYPTIRGNRVTNTNGADGPQQHGVWLRGATTTVGPTIRDNETAVAATPGVRIGHTITDTTRVGDNVERTLTPAPDPDPEPEPAAWSDDFNRADGLLAGQTTPSGDQVWKATGAGVPQIVSNQLAIRNGVGTAYIDDGITGDGTLEATCADVGIEQTTALIFRARIPSNSYLGVKARTNFGDRRWTLVEKVGGAESVIQTLAPTSTDGDTIRVEVDGTTVTVWINDTQEYTGTVTEGATYTGWGVYNGANNDDVRWDDISVTLP